MVKACMAVGSSNPFSFIAASIGKDKPSWAKLFFSSTDYPVSFKENTHRTKGVFAHQRGPVLAPRRVESLVRTGNHWIQEDRLIQGSEWGIVALITILSSFCTRTWGIWLHIGVDVMHTFLTRALCDRSYERFTVLAQSLLSLPWRWENFDEGMSHGFEES